MQIEEYTSNSNKSKMESEHAAKGMITIKQQSELTKAKRDFFKSDAKSVGSYILTDILIPSFKKLLLDTVNNALSMALNGSPKGTQTSASNGSPVRISYRDRFSQTTAAPTRNLPVTYPEDIEFNNKEDADDVLKQMREILERYSIVSIDEMFDIIRAKFGNSVGIISAYTSRNYGWFDLSPGKADVIQLSNGKYYIKLPPARPI